MSNQTPEYQKIRIISEQCTLCIEKDKQIFTLQSDILLQKEEISNLKKLIQDLQKPDTPFSDTQISFAISQTQERITYILNRSQEFQQMSENIASEHLSQELLQSSLIYDTTTAALLQYLIQQGKRGNEKITCMCDNVISLNKIRLKFNQYDYLIVQHFQLVNQIKKLKETLGREPNFRTCKNSYCSFFYLQQEQIPPSWYCPNCLI